MNDYILTLQYPITVAGSPLDRIELRRPQVRDLMAMREMPNQAESELALLSALSVPHLDRDAILQLDLADYRGLQAVLARLMGVVSPIG